MKPQGERQREWLRALGAVLATVAVVAFVWWLRRAPDWRLIKAEGVVEHDRLATGGYLRTKALSRGVLQVADIGEITVRDESSLHFEEGRAGRRRVALDYGTLDAQITAGSGSDPGVFIVHTPGARAAGMDCEYTLRIGRQGGGFLRVKQGWVTLAYVDARSLVPKDAMAVIGLQGQFSPPFFTDASRLFQSALTSWTLGAGGNRAALFGAILHEARPRDVLTLLDLFRDASTEQRYLLADRIRQLVPGLPEISRDQLTDWNPRVVEQWRPAVVKSLDLPPLPR